MVSGTSIITKPTSWSFSLPLVLPMILLGETFATKYWLIARGTERYTSYLAAFATSSLKHLSIVASGTTSPAPKARPTATKPTATPIAMAFVVTSVSIEVFHYVVTITQTHFLATSL